MTVSSWFYFHIDEKLDTYFYLYDGYITDKHHMDDYLNCTLVNDVGIKDPLVSRKLAKRMVLLQVSWRDGYLETRLT